MKKFSKLLLTAASAALVSLTMFSCGDPTIGTTPEDPYASIPENPPESVGEDPFKGKTLIDHDEPYYTFNSDNTCTRDNLTYKYSYNTEKKELYLLLKSVKGNNPEGKIIEVDSAKEYGEAYKTIWPYEKSSNKYSFYSLYAQTYTYYLFSLWTFKYEFDASENKITLTQQPQPLNFGTGYFRYSTEEGEPYFRLSNGILSYGTDTMDNDWRGFATIDTTAKTIYCDTVYNNPFNGSKEECDKKSIKFFASYVEKDDGSLELTVKEKSADLNFIPNTVLLSPGEPHTETYTIE